MLIAENVSFSYRRQPIIANVSLHCEPGEMIALVGASGCGKTTFLNILAGTLKAQSGRVRVEDMAPAVAAKNGCIGYIPQSPTLVPWLSARQNVALPLALRKRGFKTRLFAGVGVDIDDAQVVQAMEAAHILGAADKMPDELSGGMQTRVSIARSISYRPQLLLADEPLSALDDVVRELLYADLQEVTAAQGTAAVLVTHNLSEAILLCDRVYVMAGGSHVSPSRIVHVEHVPFSRPRRMDVLGDPLFMAARARVREALG